MKNGDQPAFPQSYEKDDNRRKVIENGFAVYGLSKREYFAAMAMQGICATTGLKKIEPETCAVWSVLVADELLKQLEP